MQLIRHLWDIFVHLDKHLNQLAADYGSWLYGLLFLIIFAETGLVVTPFLPGDSLLFAVGALAASDQSPINIWAVGLLLCAAAVIGDAVNYAIGKRIGPKVFHKEDSKLFNKEHLKRAHEFYEKYGGKTIIIARFIPIIRTFAPFVAGIGKMTYPKFAIYNVTGAVLWVASFLLLGYKFGDLPIVKKNFTFVILAIIVISCIPPVIEIIRARRAGARGLEPAIGATTAEEDRTKV